MIITTTSQFEKDFKLMIRQNKDIAKLSKVIDSLANGNLLSSNHKDHKLKGNYIGHRECHIEPDWLLIYRTTKTHLYLTRTGSHSDLFR